MPMRFAWPIFALVLLASGLSSRLAFAATASASFSVSATVQATCQAIANPAAFETYTSVAANAALPVSVTCSNSAQYNVSLNAGMGTGAPLAIRKVADSRQASPGYALSTIPQGIVNRGQIAGADKVIGTGSRSIQVLSDHGQIAAGRYITADAYFDTIVVTVAY